MNGKYFNATYVYVLTGAIAVGLLGPSYSVGLGQSVEEFDSEVPEMKVESTRESPKNTVDLAQAADGIVAATNEFRAAHNLRELQKNETLGETAQYFADFMARTKKYGHTADGKRPSERAAEHGYEFCIVLENIAYAYRTEGFQTNALTTKFMEGWKHSQGHRENMLDPDIFETGVAVARSEDAYQFFAVQMFGRPSDKAIQFQVENDSDKEIAYSLVRKDYDKSFTLPPRVRRTHTVCRPSMLDLKWTEADDQLAVRQNRQFVIQSSGDGLKVNTSDAE